MLVNSDNQKPILVIMAAGMGSRYGGLKQIDPVGNNGQLLLDYSLFDAYRAGFRTVVFVIKKEIEDAFRKAIGERFAHTFEVKYAFQELNDLPEGYAVPEKRTKPWGTAHAILAARGVVDGPFAVINADDYYGPDAFKKIYDYLDNNRDTGDRMEFCMVGYLLGNTVTEHGHVARGICTEDDAHFLKAVVERTRIEKDGADDARFTEDGGATWTSLPADTIVSMNLWGLSKGFMKEAWNRFPVFLEKALAENPEKGEYFLPSVISQLVNEGKAQAKVLQSHDKWYGVTYQEDKPKVCAAIADMTASGLYPDSLWEK